MTEPNRLAPTGGAPDAPRIPPPTAESPQLDAPRIEPGRVERMRIDVVTIFPEYLDPLRLSLIGRAGEEGLLSVRAWDLREFTDDRHRTVDDTPYGGGAGMVMLPEPWGRALDAIEAEARAAAGPAITAVAATGDAATGDTSACDISAGDAEAGGPVIAFPSPSGEPFTQRMAQELANEKWLVFGCGRYEGIDERVFSYARDRHPGRVRTVSLGDYVLNGGEVAVLAMVEAIARLIPGVIGNAESLTEESHTDGLLEYPVYTRPPSWRGYDVPAVLRSGDHGAVATWRHEQQLARTVARRPDLLHPSALAALGDGPPGELRPARAQDCPELLVLMRASWVKEGRDNDAWEIPPLVESLADVRDSLRDWHTWVLRAHGRLIGSVRGKLDDDGAWNIGRIMVAEDLRGRGIGRWLLSFAEAQAPAGTARLRLFTGERSVSNLRLYRKAGYRPSGRPSEFPGGVELTKRLPAAESPRCTGDRGSSAT